METIKRKKMINNRTMEYIEDYWDIVLGVVAIALAIALHLKGHGYIATALAAIGITTLSLTVAEVAEILSERLEEPYASMVLTFSAVIVEIVLLYIILLQAFDDPQVLETVKGGIISAVIVDMNVLLGLAVFIGGLKFTEQTHNKETSSTYTTILLVTALALLVPSLLNQTEHSTEVIKEVSMIIAAVLMLFYIVIFIFQTRTHTHFFKATARSRMFRIKKRREEDEEENEEETVYIFETFNNLGNFITIFLLIAVIALGAEVFATDGIKMAKEFGISAGLAGLIIAIIAVAPEIATAIKAAKNDQIQRVVNIAMGASVVSILLTVPILLALAYMSGINLLLDFNPLQVGALIMTIILAWKSTEEGQTNYFEGLSHLMFFLCYAIIAAYY